jgi:hypothetical protein
MLVNVPFTGSRFIVVSAVHPEKAEAPIVFIVQPESVAVVSAVQPEKVEGLIVLSWAQSDKSIEVIPLDWKAPLPMDVSVLLLAVKLTA